MNHYSYASNRRQQRGAALMIAMVMIFMLSVLGISAMRDATLEGQLASNAVQKEITFQAAESATDTVLAITNVADAKAIESVICSNAPAVHQLPGLGAANNQQTSVSIEYGGRTVPIGTSLGGPIGARRFIVTGNSSLPEVNTSTRISQGVVLVGAMEAGAEC